MMCAEVYHTLKRLLDEDGYSTAVGDEGGFAPDLKNGEEVLTYLIEAVKKSGYQPGKDIQIDIRIAPASCLNRPPAPTFSRGRAGWRGGRSTAPPGR